MFAYYGAEKIVCQAVSLSPLNNAEVRELSGRYQCASNGRAIFNSLLPVENVSQFMATASKSKKDTLKMEKASLGVLGICIVVLLYLLVFRPF